jgi:hypothetical protein
MGKLRKARIALLLVARAVIIAVLAMLLTFAVALFFGIAGVLLVNLVRGGGTSLTVAYRHVALPIALIAFATAFIAGLAVEIRHYRHTRMAVKI